MNLVKLLQIAKQNAPVIKYHEVDIQNVIHISEINLQNYMKKHEKALEIFAKKIPYDIQSYDCEWLATQTLKTIQDAQKQNKKSVQIANRCCSLDDCPEVLFMKTFIDQLRV